MHQHLPTGRPPNRPFLHIGPIALSVFALGFVLLQCKSGSHSPLPSDETTTNVEQTTSATTEGMTSSTTEGDSATTDDSDTTSSGATSGGQGGDGDGDGDGDEPCPSTWKGCPPMNTLLEPLHERQNGAGSLLLAHDAFWMQGSVTPRKPDGSRGDTYVGALRIPYAPSSTPRVLEGNVSTGMFVEHQGKVYHADSSSGRYLAVYEPNGDLHKLVDISEGDATIFMLTGLSAHDGHIAVTSPNCTHVFFIDTQNWEIRHINTEAEYAGGTTRTLFHDGSLYCMGTAHIFKFDPATNSIESQWTNPEIEMNVLSVQYSYLADTSQGLMTWIATPPSGIAPLQILDPSTLALTNYDDPGIAFANARYVADEDVLYFESKGMYRYHVGDKDLQRQFPTERPWGGRWDFKSEIEMDDDYFYWIEGWNPDGTTSLNSAEFIVRYPRNP